MNKPHPPLYPISYLNIVKIMCISKVADNIWKLEMDRRPKTLVKPYQIDRFRRVFGPTKGGVLPRGGLKHRGKHYMQTASSESAILDNAVDEFRAINAYSFERERYFEMVYLRMAGILTVIWNNRGFNLYIHMI